MEPDGWPYLQFIISGALLFLFALAGGAAAGQTSSREALEGTAGVSPAAAGGLIVSALLLAWNLACLFALSRSACLWALGHLDERGFPASLATALLFMTLTGLVMSFLVILPLSWGQAHSDSYAGRGSAVLKLTSPLKPLARLICSPARRLLERRGVADELGSVTEEDVMDDVGALEEIDEAQREMIGNIFELDDVSAADIMTHRIEVEAVPVDASLDFIINMAVESGYSRLPVYEGSLDSIIGTLSVKDLLPFVGKSAADFELRSLLRDTLYVHESIRAHDLLLRLKAAKMPLAVVVDEYGGTAGIVSMEDILESIVGDIEDEYDEEESLIARQADGSLVCEGFAEVEDVFEALGLSEPPEELESETIGGLLTELLGRIPEPCERASARLDKLELSSLGADERRITKVQARLISEDTEA
ncbi:MAG: hemolysin family protein [Oscillospiraceae bacterium]|nr:hemolysin family protein [Oscillospiraceae bacterium]